MLVDDAYLISENNNAYRKGIPSKIIGVGIVQPDNYESRLCYKVEWDDGVTDWVPVKEVESGVYKILPFVDVLFGDYPTIKNYGYEE